jgi:hypothetical protein
MIGLDSSPL